MDLKLRTNKKSPYREKTMKAGKEGDKKLELPNAPGFILFFHFKITQIFAYLKRPKNPITPQKLLKKRIGNWWHNHLVKTTSVL